MRTCTHQGGCQRAHYAHGYCNPHYKRWKATGDPGALAIQTKAPGPCGFTGCERPKSCGGMCATHYAQQHRRGRLAPIEERGDPRARDEDGRKRCSSCKRWQAVDAFGATASSKFTDGLNAWCTRCRRDRSMAKLYGITLERYEALAAAQGDVCAICTGVNDSGRSLAVDHDHSCCPTAPACGQCTRGLLCSNCNMALGLFMEDPVRLRAAIAYLAIFGAARDDHPAQV